MAVFQTIEELKNAINDTIYANDAGLITAEIVQERMHDIIDTLNAISTSVAGVKAYLESANDLTQIYAGAVKALLASDKGNAGGVAELDETGKVPAAQLPSYVDDVLDAYIVGEALTAGWLSESVGGAVLTPETRKIYVVLTAGEYQNKTYRWSGSTYVEISPSLVLGETSSTAYRGDRAKIAYDHSQTTHDKAFVGLANVDNTSDANKPISSAAQNALDLKAPLASPTFTGSVLMALLSIVANRDSDVLGYFRNTHASGFGLAIDGGAGGKYILSLRTYDSVEKFSFLSEGLTASGYLKGSSLKTTNWSFEEDGDDLVIKRGGVIKARLSSAAVLKTKGEQEVDSSI